MGRKRKTSDPDKGKFITAGFIAPAAGIAIASLAYWDYKRTIEYRKKLQDESEKEKRFGYS